MEYKDAVELATRQHDGQYRKNSGEPYITHPLAVAEKFVDEDLKIVAVLHDTIEDTDLSICDLVRHHNLRMDLVYALAAISRSVGQTYLDFILQVKENKIATAVKIEDLKHNLSDLMDGSLRDKYLMALYILQGET